LRLIINSLTQPCYKSHRISRSDNSGMRKNQKAQEPIYGFGTIPRQKAELNLDRTLSKNCLWRGGTQYRRSFVYIHSRFAVNFKAAVILLSYCSNQEVDDIMSNNSELQTNHVLDFEKSCIGDVLSHPSLSKRRSCLRDPQV
jgi:hypothetical protein